MNKVYFRISLQNLNASCELRVAEYTMQLNSKLLIELNSSPLWIHNIAVPTVNANEAQNELFNNSYEIWKQNIFIECNKLLMILWLIFHSLNFNLNVLWAMTVELEFFFFFWGIFERYDRKRVYNISIWIFASPLAWVGEVWMRRKESENQK